MVTLERTWVHDELVSGVAEHGEVHEQAVDVCLHGLWYCLRAVVAGWGLGQGRASNICRNCMDPTPLSSL